MPEGHSIRAAADLLRAALAGQTIIAFRSSFKKAAAQDWTAKVLGHRVAEVRSHGKNLFVELDNAWVLYTHMLMWGSWHVYARGEPWRKEERKARVVLETEAHVAVLFSAPICELIHRDELATHRTSESGPDLLADDFDAAEALRRLQMPEHSGREIGELIMDQTVVGGIGNVLKSEILFEAGIHPQRVPPSLGDDEWQRLLETARRLIARSYELGTFQGAFVAEGVELEPSKYGQVYRRRTYPCLRCGTPIQMVRQGARRRMTYFCPSCQPIQG